jgi:hypothetical protein
MMNQPAQSAKNRLAQLVLAAFVVTFAICRVTVYLIMAHQIPNLYLHVGETHVHHLNYGIFLMCGTGAYLLFCRPTGNLLSLSAALYGVGLGLIFDEYGMLIGHGGPYWQQASFYSVMVIAALLGVVVAAPRLGRFRARQWVGAVTAIFMLTSFGRLLAGPVQRVEKKCMSHLIRIEQTSPR